eukprot:gnl/Hemi2/418_TR141_c0_g1_i1.p1 gnl/Hemi2/418_TR141_c0_g1~~gnl/Hemi2/418_TR141_c0_g1_i1.p1  ORF type:complete len:361 (+),score=106.36 gnl/Hemi2/418_TR141_c0_g1_i1:931-2013(+)
MSISLRKSSDRQATKKVKTPLNSNDKIFAEIRDLNISVLGPLLKRKANYISENYKERHNLQTPAEMRDFMRKVNTLQQDRSWLVLHVNTAEWISTHTRDRKFHKRIEAEQNYVSGQDLESTDFIEECINRQEPLTRVLRLLCLYSLTNNGMSQKKLDFFRHEILQTYGYEYIFTLVNLEKLGLLRLQEGRNAWKSLAKLLRLLVEDLDEHSPQDIAYVYSGYAPLSVRIIQAMCRAVPPNTPWFRQQGLEDALRLLPGPHFEEKQSNHMLQVMEQQAAAAAAGTADASQAPTDGKRPKVTLVFFLGGACFTEISALRFLRQHDNSGRDYIIATTKLINGNSLLKSLVELPENGFRGHSAT